MKELECYHKRLFIASLVMSVLVLIITVVGNYFLPKDVPIHYNSLGEIDKSINRIWILTIGILLPAIAFGVVELSDASKLTNKKKLIINIIAMVVSVILIFLQTFFLVKILSKVDSGMQNNWEYITSFIITIVGCLLLIVAVVLWLVKPHCNFVLELLFCSILIICSAFFKSNISIVCLIVGLCVFLEALAN